MSKKVQALILGVMCLILTISICVQIKTVENNGVTIGRNETEIQLKDQVLKMKEKYENAYDRLNKAQEELESVRESVTSNNEELEKLEKEIGKNNMLLGFTDVKGTGVTITATDGIMTPTTLNANDLLIHDTDLLCIINELKNSGAEAIEINGKRIVNTTSIMCDGNVITINGEKISSPFVINAIGLPEQMATLKRPNGYLDFMKNDTIKIDFKKQKELVIPKYTGVINFKTAKNVK
ncbi:MAG: DUF881 domain-containing protein [Clostridia bacterium]|nr:DUF881 domain-containing protein [Clostridia bacterium]